MLKNGTFAPALEKYIDRVKPQTDTIISIGVAEKKSFKKACFIKGKGFIFALPNREDFGVHCKTGDDFISGFLERNFFSKKLAGLKRSCTFAAALGTKVRRAGLR